MLRIDAVLVVLAMLPLLMAVLVRGFVVEGRKNKMTASLGKAKDATANDPNVVRAQRTCDLLDQGIDRVKKDFNSLYGTRFFVPAALLSFLYLVGFSLALSSVADTGKCAGVLCRPFDAFPVKFLYGPVFAIFGSYIFHTGVMVRRSFMADITKNVYWSSVNRLIFTVGFSLVISLLPIGMAKREMSFAVAFFPGVAITWLRKRFRQNLQMTESSVCELEVQLIQGVDIWKEDRLMEEGIESVQNLATANVFMLAARMHYPIRTIVNWMDQAILIQRFPSQLKAFTVVGVPVSAMEMAQLASKTNKAEIADALGRQLAIDPLVLTCAMDNLAEDVVVSVLLRLWQTPDTE